MSVLSAAVGRMIAGIVFALAIGWPAVPLLHAQTSPLATTEQQAPWQPPDINHLQTDWWQQFDSPSKDDLEQRMGQFTETARSVIVGLDGQNLLTGQSLLQNVRAQFDLLLAARHEPKPEPFEPIPTRDTYTLDELLALRAQGRELEKRQIILQLRAGELASQSALLESRRDNLLGQYSAAEENAPARVLLGLQRVAARIEFERVRELSDNLDKRLAQYEQRLDLLSQQLGFARQNLVVNDTEPEVLDERIAAEGRRVNELSERLSDVQRELLRVLSGPDARPSLEVLRKQQLTRASAELALAKLRQLKSQAQRRWLQLRSGKLNFNFDLQRALVDVSDFVDETSRQIEVWSSASQTTLLTAPPGADLNSVKNIELAHAAARETLARVDKMEDAIDDLGLLREVLTAEKVGTQPGLRNLWTRFSIAAGEARLVFSGYLDITLFHIGETPVTLGHIFSMLMILVFGYALSWFIRHMLERLKGRRQFAKSPAVYTLGRILHYIIIAVAVFAAFGAIGLDFRNFALIAGALSVGIGFGLQSIVNNFVSGLILLFEGSLRVGDYIELETGLRGVVKEINTRATIINTNDNVDMVVPNSTFVTNQLTNWTLREPMARFRIEFGVAYGSDKEQVKAAALAAADNVEFIIHHMPSREPEVWLVDYSDSALVFQLLAWVTKAGVRRPERVRSVVLWELETQLRKHGIEIPFPQRDLHLRSGFLPASESS